MKTPSLKNRDCRILAAQVVVAVLYDHMSLAKVLPIALEQTPEKDQSLLQELCYGTIRHAFSLHSKISKYLSKPLKEKDSDILALLLIGAYQLLHTRIPAYAAINSSVNGASVFKKIWAKGLINAVLRNIQREMDATKPSDTQNNFNSLTEEAIYDHPQWLIDKIKHDHTVCAESILLANNSKAPMTLRINRQRITRDEYLCLLADAGITTRAALLSADAIQLDTAVDVSKLPLFADGAVSIQDEAAQLSAALLCLTKNLSVLDACAAPGGKTCHMLEIEPSLIVTALDVDAQRGALIHENLCRLHLSANVVAGDACRPDIWWQNHCGGKPFDRILVDAPCSATGVIRHHPDIKFLRQASDIPALAKTQLQILCALWPLLKADGILLYATCSILNQENDSVVSQFLSLSPGAHIDVIKETWGMKTVHGRQLLPQKDGYDGFYFARIKKSG